MKKTISINIAGVVFNIEEDGYEKLRNYLNSIQKYFASYEDSKEILSDIEGRVAERFMAKLKAADKQAIALDDVDELVKAMGSVADFEAIEEEEDLVAEPTARTKEQTTTSKVPDVQPIPRKSTFNTGDKKLYRDKKRKLLGGVCAGIANYLNMDPLLIRLVFLLFFIGLTPIMGGLFGGDAAEVFGPLSGVTFLLYIALWVSFPGSTTLEEDKNVKKFYRDTDKKVLGGVAGGVAAYFGTDVGVVRFLWVLSILFFGTGFLLYIILWAITPKAVTLTEKMEMTGQPITLENIETNVKRSLQPENPETENTFTKLLLLPFRAVAAIFRGLTPLAGFIVTMIRVFAGLLLLLIGGSAVVGLLVALFSVFGLSTWDFSQIDGDFAPLTFFFNEVSPAAYFFVFLAIGIPFAFIGWAGLSLLTRENKFSSAVWQTMLGLFLAGLLGTAIFGGRYGREFRRTGTFEKTQEYNWPAQTALFTINDMVDDNNNYNDVDLDLEAHDANNLKLVSFFKAQGRNREVAEQNAKEITYNVIQRDSALTFDENLALKASKFRGQRLDMKLYVPYDKPFSMSRDFFYHFGISGNLAHDYNFGEDDDAFQKARFVFKRDSGLVCLNRPIVIENNTDSDDASDMNEMTEGVGGGIESGLDEAFSESFGDEVRGGFVKQFDVRNFQKVGVGGVFVVSVKQGADFKVTVDGREEDVDDVVMKVEDNTLQISNRTKFSLFGNNRKRVGVTITMPTITSLDLSGATLGQVTGFEKLNELDVEISGASKTQISVNVQKMDLDASGASKIELRGSANTLNAELSGACKLDAEDMRIQRADVSASGASRASLGKVPDLKSNTSGASKIDSQQ